LPGVLAVFRMRLEKGPGAIAGRERVM